MALKRMMNGAPIQRGCCIFATKMVAPFAGDCDAENSRN